MILDIDRDRLLAVAERAAAAVPAGLVTPELACLWLVATAGELTATGFDGTVWARASCAATVTAPGQCLLPAHELRRWLGACDKGDGVRLAAGPRAVRLDADRSAARQAWPVLPVEAYPAPRTFGEPTARAVVPALGLRAAIDRAAAMLTDRDIASESQGTRYEGGRVFLSVGDGVGVACAAQTGTSIASVPLGDEPPAGRADAALMSRCLPAVTRLLADADGPVQLSVSPAEVVLGAEGHTVGCRLAAGRTPPWREYAERTRGKAGPPAEFNPRDLLRAFRLATAVRPADDKGFCRVRFDFSEGVVHLSVGAAAAVKLAVAGGGMAARFDLGSDPLGKVLDVAARQGHPLSVQVVPDGAGRPLCVRLSAEGWEAFAMCLSESGGG